MAQESQGKKFKIFEKSKKVDHSTVKFYERMIVS